jgi:hypothetical protein
MLVSLVPSDYWTKIVAKREFLEALIREGLDPILMLKAIRNHTIPPFECHEIFFEVPLIEKIKDSDPEKSKNIFNAIRFFSALLKNPIVQDEEKKALACFKERITKEYDLDRPSYKELLDLFRSETDLKDVENYATYSEESVGWEIDARLRTGEQCGGKLVDMLLRYMEKFSTSINEKMPVGHERDYTQRDIFELIAEILNLRTPGRCEYDYEKIRTSYGNFLRAKA